MVGEGRRVVQLPDLHPGDRMSMLFSCKMPKVNRKQQDVQARGRFSSRLLFSEQKASPAAVSLPRSS